MAFCTQELHTVLNVLMDDLIKIFMWTELVAFCITVWVLLGSHLSEVGKLEFGGYILT